MTHQVKKKRTHPTSTKVTSRAAQPTPTLPVNNRATRLALTRLTGRNSRHRRLSHLIALSKASLASVAAVEVLVLDIVLGPAVAGRRAAAVEVTVCPCAGTRHAALGVAAHVDFGDGGREDAACGGARGCALGFVAREGGEAGFGVAVVGGGAALGGVSLGLELELELKFEWRDPLRRREREGA